MAKQLNTQDCYALMNQIVKEATGQASMAVVDVSSFQSAGELVLASGVENTLNSLSIVLGRTFMAVRPYQAKLRIFNTINNGAYANRMRKISLYSKDALPSGEYNTQLYTNYGMGFDNGVNPDSQTPPQDQSTMSMWEQNQPVPLEMNFGGSSVWQDSITRYENALKIAFRGPEEFAEFVAGVMTEKGNDIESQKEAFNRGLLLGHMAMVADVDAITSQGSVIDLTAGFNAKYGTSYNRTQILQSHLTEFLEYFVAEFKGVSEKMTYRSKKYHWSPTKTINGVSYSLLRHTPKDRQKALLYEPLFRDSKAMVLPQIFNPQYLDIKNYEGVEFWQAEASGPSINVTPAIPDVAGTNNGEQTAGTTVALDYVVGCIFDEDAAMIDYQLDTARTTPVEARKGYMNTWWTFRKNMISDATENFVLFVML